MSTPSSPTRADLASICLPRAAICSRLALVMAAASSVSFFSSAIVFSRPSCISSIICLRMPKISDGSGLYSSSDLSVDRKDEIRSRSEVLMSRFTVSKRSCPTALVCRKALTRPFSNAAMAFSKALMLDRYCSISLLSLASSFSLRDCATARDSAASLRSAFACSTSLFRRSSSAWLSLMLLSSCGSFVSAAPMLWTSESWLLSQ
mmetsp:Transcript_47456/g.94364  ORF Transcript_47456/g.94364 Transcript_47456/m.94364 type:complete len:205 (-) Transcript_47456:289-903(-)